MRILLAPDKFKGTLTQREACAAMGAGVKRAAREAGIEVVIDECLVADGGEGTLEAIGSVIPTLVMAEAATLDPTLRLGMRAEWGCWRHDADLIACIESARAVGLHLVDDKQRDPERLTTFALGSLIGAALSAHCTTILIGLGGSSTIDGGTGAAQALGWTIAGDHRFQFEIRREREVALPGGLATVGLRRPSCTHAAELGTASFIALCDVQNPLLGPRGAARQFGPQKGATPEQVERLEAGLENLVRVCRACGIPCDPDQPGAGAAGGLGFGLATFLGATLVPGAPYILDLLKFDERCAAADLVITGEGKMDMQTAEGKACAEVAKRAESACKPSIAVVGQVEGHPDDLRKRLAACGVRFEAIHATIPAKNAATALEDATCNALRDWLSRTRDEQPPTTQP